jgi:hypothetical protein
MAFEKLKSLRDRFQAAVRGLYFYAEEVGFEINKSSGRLLGGLGSMVMPKDEIFAFLKEPLEKGHLTQMNAASLLNALSLRHSQSKFNPVSYLKNHIRLYNASIGHDDPIDEVARIEKIKRGSINWQLLQSAYYYPMVKDAKGNSGPEQQLQSLKIRAWALDLEAATGISFKETEELLALYRHPTLVTERERKTQPTTALPKEIFLPLLRKLRSDKWFGVPALSDTQAGIILCHLLHARETRDGGASYVTHPMAVANLVLKFGNKFLPHDNEESKWVAACIALKHDGGEKSGININEDLEGLHSDRVIKGVRMLHKVEGDTYFEYIEKLANHDLVTAFVKLCDIIHNSSDKKEDPSSKQAFVYLIAANYLKYRLDNKYETLSVKEYLFTEVVKDKYLAEDLYRSINDIAESKDIKNASGEVTEKADKKKKASEFPELKDMMDVLVKRGKLTQILNLLSVENNSINAHPRRKEDFTLQPRTDV